MRLVFRGMSEQSSQINCKSSNAELKNIRLQTTKKEHPRPGVFLFFSQPSNGVEGIRTLVPHIRTTN